MPNSSILSNHIVNYSTLATQHGLILHTTVGIGYETPWRQVEAMLIMAAERTPGLLKEPPPFVLQKNLGDFCVTYEINAHCDNAQAMARLYTDLHRNILDLFNEYGVQIMTPAYEGDPQQPKAGAEGAVVRRAGAVAGDQAADGARDATVTASLRRRRVRAPKVLEDEWHERHIERSGPHHAPGGVPWRAGRRDVLDPAAVPPATIWAATIVVATWPVMLFVQSRLWGKRGLAVTVMTLALLLMLLVPLALAIITIAQNADRIVGWVKSLMTFRIPPPPDWIGGLPVVGPGWRSSGHN